MSKQDLLVFDEAMFDQAIAACEEAGWNFDYPAQPGIRANSYERPEAEPSLIVDVRQHPLFEGLNRLEQRSALQAETALNLLGMQGQVDLPGSKRILDFGAASGGSTLPLVRLAELNGGVVEAVERNPKSHGDLVASNILPPERVHLGDGLVFLNREMAGGERYDLITAFMFGPDRDGSLTSRLLAAARGALSGEGRLVVTSDTGTMAKVEEVCELAGCDYQVSQGVPLDQNETLPTTIVVSRITETITSPRAPFSPFEFTGGLKAPEIEPPEISKNFISPEVIAEMLDART